MNRKFAIALALAGMWLLSSVGFLLYFRSNEWMFIGLRGYDFGTIRQVGGFFLAWFGVRIPAASFAGIIISFSNFSHPLRATFWTMAAYHLLLSAIRAVHWPWKAFHDLNQSAPILAYSISIFLLIGTSVFFAWLMPRWHNFFQKNFRH